MLAGLGAQEKAELELTKASDYFYLTQVSNVGHNFGVYQFKLNLQYRAKH